MKSKVISNQKINDKFAICELYAESLLTEARADKKGLAGRFIMVSTHDRTLSFDPILNRPFAIADINGDNIKFIYMIVGRGTKELLKAKQNDELELVGALGNRFHSDKIVGSVAVVAGGIGIAPCILLGRELMSKGINTTLYYGGRSKSDIILPELLSEIYDKFIPITEDGTFGEKGLVTNQFENEISKFSKIYACGPNRMLEAVTKITLANNKPIEVSLDEQMACGVGACLGCMIDLNEGDKLVQKRCCVEGPVFDGSKVDWGRLCNR